MRNILKFKRPEAKPRCVKRKPRPSLRVIRSGSDLRIPKAEFKRLLDSWVETLGVDNEICEESKYVWVALVERQGWMPQLRYAVHRRTGDIYGVEGLTMSIESCGNIM
jgi:hypothetical protein